MTGQANCMIEVSAIVIRADGKKEDLGIIASNKRKKKSIFNILKGKV